MSAIWKPVHTQSFRVILQGCDLSYGKTFALLSRLCNNNCVQSNIILITLGDISKSKPVEEQNFPLFASDRSSCLQTMSRSMRSTQPEGPCYKSTILAPFAMGGSSVRDSKGAPERRVREMSWRDERAVRSRQRDHIRLFLTDWGPQGPMSQSQSP